MWARERESKREKRKRKRKRIKEVSCGKKKGEERSDENEKKERKMTAQRRGTGRKRGSGGILVCVVGLKEEGLKKKPNQTREENVGDT